MALLELETISSGYAGSMVIHDVSMNVEEGQVTALLGRNGVGKTTTLRTIVGLLDVQTGHIRYDGADITGLEPHETYARGIGFVTEERSVFPDLTVLENLRVPIVESSERAWSMETIFEFFPTLEGLAGSKGKNLSGGEQQMLAIARALRPGPRLLLLDEPTEGLAPQIVRDVAGIIEQISETGTTVLLVEQNIELSLDLADHVYIMDMGQIVFDGGADELTVDDQLIERHLGIKREF